MNKTLMLAPELDISDWLNTTKPLKLSELRGKVIVMHAFQMLCPGCVIHGIPQTSAIYNLYRDNDDVQVIGLHSVFEHHDVMTKDALIAFVHEYQIQFPIAIDKPATTGNIPVTMERYQLQGTPSLILIDRDGNIRLNHFGRMNDLYVGNYIEQLLSIGSNVNNTIEKFFSKNESGNCNDEYCTR